MHSANCLMVCTWPAALPTKADTCTRRWTETRALLWLASGQGSRSRTNWLSVEECEDTDPLKEKSGTTPNHVAALPSQPPDRPVVVTGLFRANPSSTMVQGRMVGAKGTNACRHC